MNENLTKAKYNEYLASIFGACFVAFGLGVLLANYFQWLAIPLIIIGVIIHSWGMYKVHQRIK